MNKFFRPAARYYVEPYLRGNSRLHVSFYKRDYRRAADFECFTSSASELSAIEVPLGPLLASSGGLAVLLASACAATGEYTQFHGGTVADGLAAIVTAINRVSGVGEGGLAIRFGPGGEQ